MAVTKDDITNQVQDHLGISRRECKEVVEAFFDQIKTSLSACEEVKLQSFGNFSLREKSERPGRNPKTGEPFRIAPRRVVTFHASQQLKNLVKYPPSPKT